MRVLREHYLRGGTEATRGYLSLSPMLVVVGLSIVVPATLIVLMRFWTLVVWLRYLMERRIECEAFGL